MSFQQTNLQQTSLQQTSLQQTSRQADKGRADEDKTDNVGADPCVCPYTYNHIHNKIKDFYFVLSQLYANFAC